MDPKKIAKYLKQLKIDAYVVYDFRGSNFLGRQALGIDVHATRRWIAVITQKAEVTFLIPKLELALFDKIPGEKVTYTTYQEYEESLGRLLQDKKTIALEYSADNNIPNADIVPSGFTELIKKVSPKTQVVSSADLTQYLAASWGKKGYEGHKRSAKVIADIAQKVFGYVADNISKKITDFDVMSFILDIYEKNKIFAEDGLCIVATNEQAGNPHYWPKKDDCHEIKPNSVFLVDMWAKEKDSHSVYADSTVMAWIGPDPVPAKVKEVWEVVSGARDVGIEFVMKNIDKDLRGYQVDRAVRDFIDSKGYGEYFIHRTGHSIDTADHGNGANMDDYETKDTRKVLPDTGFSIEPGVYLPEFGARSEVDVYINEKNKPEVTTWMQKDLEII